MLWIKLKENGVILVLFSVMGYALLPVWVKTIQAAGMSSLDIATWRFVLAAPLFWVMVRLSGGHRGMSRLPRFKLLLMGAMLAVAALTAFWGLERLPAGTYVVLFYSYPVMVAILSAALGERLPRVAWASLALTSIGVVLSVPDFGSGLKAESLIGVLLALVNAFIVAVYFIVNGRLMRGQSGIAASGALAVTGALIVYVLLAPFRTLAVPQNSTVWLSLIALAAISTVMPVFFLTAGIQNTGPSRAAIIGTIEPVLTAIFSALFLGETAIQPIQIIGAALILLSVVLLQRATRTPRRSVAAASSGQ
ncbi:MAG: DMT family transporter [Anaerolineae bacterium]|nr:DMT family transporter [Anaerolineae bacterium]